MEKRFDLVGIGSMVVDLIYRTPRIIGNEEKIALDRHNDGSTTQKLVGGVTLNHLSWAGLMGLRTGIFGKQANDEYGRFLRAGMDRYSIDKHITLDGASSSFAHIFVDPNGGRAIYMSPAATSETTGDYIRAEHADYIRSAKIVSTEISQLPLDAVVAVLEIAREAGVVTVLDVDIPRSDALKALGNADDFERALQLADYLKPSKAAVIEMLGENDALLAAKALREKYKAKAVVITDGEAGCAIATDEMPQALNARVTAYRTKAVDSTGAGDAFFGGMIAGLHFGLVWADVLKLANACGAACCEILGATPDLKKSRERVFELYDGTPFKISPPVISAAIAEHSAQENAVENFLNIALTELTELRAKITPEYFNAAADLIQQSEANGGRLHVSGIGKPEHVSDYVAALLSSTGTRAYFLHGTECVHGSAGQVAPEDAVIVISNSGETEEMKATVTTLQKNGVKIIGVSGNPQSWLAERSEVFLYAGVAREGGPLGCEPRASILAEIYVLAALSVELQARKGVSRSAYHSWHPGGSIGKATGPLPSLGELLPSSTKS